MAATRVKRAGKQTLFAARDTVTDPSSNGCRRTSNTWRSNSGSSSKNRPRCGPETLRPGGERPAADQRHVGNGVVGASKGRSPMGAAGPRPATEWIFRVSNDSSKPMGGKRPGKRRANMVLPEPGGPIINMLWAPAAATSSARLANIWPSNVGEIEPVFHRTTGPWTGEGQNSGRPFLAQVVDGFLKACGGDQLQSLPPRRLQRRWPREGSTLPPPRRGPRERSAEHPEPGAVARPGPARR
jgi:hypothetical protein